MAGCMRYARDECLSYLQSFVSLMGQTGSTADFSKVTP